MEEPAPVSAHPRARKSTDQQQKAAPRRELFCDVYHKLTRKTPPVITQKIIVVIFNEELFLFSCQSNCNQICSCRTAEYLTEADFLRNFPHTGTRGAGTSFKGSSTRILGSELSSFLKALTTSRTGDRQDSCTALAWQVNSLINQYFHEVKRLHTKQHHYLHRLWIGPLNRPNSLTGSSKNAEHI